MALTGTWTPKLGLDLQGGTSVTLTPRLTSGGRVDAGAVTKAVDIIRERVNGLGVAEAEVKKAGNQIEIAVPGRGRNDVVELVGQTAELRFREVVTSVPAAQPPADVAKAADAAAAADPAAPPPRAVLDRFKSPAFTCAPSDVRSAGTATDAPGDWTAACDRSGAFKYLLKPAKVIGTDVKTASAGIDSAAGVTTSVTTGQWQIQVSFTGKGQGKFTALTEATVGRQVAIVLDGVVQSAPETRSRIPGDATISGSFSQSEAEDLANVLRYGALPLAFENSSAQSISPTLGRDSLHGGLLAGALGLAVVVLYAFAYYRAMGIVVITSLAVSGMLVYASVVLLGEAIGFTLTLAGIAGLIVSIGITADSFVVYFERIKDEVRRGRSVRASVDRAWPSARRTMLSADTVSFLAAAVLYVLSVGSVRGFAFTLGLSTIVDVLIMFIFTRPLVTILARRKFYATSRFSGLTVTAADSGRPPSQRPRLARRPAGGPGLTPARTPRAGAAGPRPTGERRGD
jgi:preprotein translocase subunit SecD